MNTKVARWNAASGPSAHRRLHWYATESSLLGFCGQRERQTTEFGNFCLPSRLSILAFPVRKSCAKSKEKIYRWSKTENLNEKYFLQLPLSLLPSSFLKVPNVQHQHLHLWIKVYLPRLGSHYTLSVYPGLQLH